MTKKNKNQIRNSHDIFFRTSMANKEVAHSFLKTWLPGELYQITDLDNLEMQPRSQINDIRQESEVDVLFKTTMNGHDAYLYILLEHQSTPDQLMPFRLLKYTCNIIDQYLKTHGGSKIPLVYSTVVYNGIRKYPFSTNLADLVDAPKELVEHHFLKPFQLIDLGQIDDEILKAHLWSGAMEFALKHIHERDVLPSLHNMAQLLHYIITHGGRSVVENVLQYYLERGELRDRQAFFELIDTKISHEVGEKIMSLAEQLRREGRQEGKQERDLEIAKRMLDEGLEIGCIIKITGLSLEKIESIKKH